jgi:hypothetical protein
MTKAEALTELSKQCTLDILRTRGAVAARDHAGVAFPKSPHGHPKGRMMFAGRSGQGWIHRLVWY